MHFLSILDNIKNYPSSPQTCSEPFPVPIGQIPMKLSLRGNGKLQSLHRNLKRVSYLLIILLLANHANGCYLCCLNRKSPDLTFINKFLIAISVLICSKLLTYRVVVSVQHRISTQY